MLEFKECLSSCYKDSDCKNNLLYLPLAVLLYLPIRKIYNYSLIISVPDIPSPYASSFDGPAGLPSLDGKGAFLQSGVNFFELTCDTSSCTWSVMAQTLDVSRTGVVMMYLPSDFECNQGN